MRRAHTYDEDGWPVHADMLDVVKGQTVTLACSKEAPPTEARDPSILNVVCEHLPAAVVPGEPRPLMCRYRRFFYMKREAPTYGRLLCILLLLVLFLIFGCISGSLSPWCRYNHIAHVLYAHV